MAKMFYTLDEAAQRLGVDADAVKVLASDGKLQQFRDRDRLMFKRDEVDALADQGADLGGAGEDLLSDTDLAASLGDSGIPLGDTDASGAIDLMGETPAPGEQKAVDSRLADSGSVIPLADSQDIDAQPAGASGSVIDMADTGGGSGISVFDSGEIDAADPLAQTQPTGSGGGEDTDLSLDSISSGSGLLDLTHEHDDTSLGVELDEIMPQDTAAGSMLEAAPASSTAASAILEEMASEGGPALEAAPVMATGGVVMETYDPQGSGLAAGLLIGCLIALLLALLAAVAGVMDAPSAIASLIGASTGSVLAWAGGVLVFSLVLGGIGFVVGKSRA